MALSTYLVDETIPVTLPGDDGNNPTVFHVIPMNGEAAARWFAVQEFAKEKAVQGVEDTIQAREAKAKAAYKQKVVFLVARTRRIENIQHRKPGYRTIDDTEEILEVYNGLLAEQVAAISNIIMDSTRLEYLKFRGDAVPGAESVQGQGEEGGEGTPEGDGSAGSEPVVATVAVEPEQTD